MDDRWLKEKKALIKEVGKQSRKFIDIYDKGYDAYHLTASVNRKYYNFWSQDNEYQIWDENVYFGDIVFLAPKDIEITLDNVFDYCELYWGWRMYVVLAFNNKPIVRKCWWKDDMKLNYVEEYKFNTPMTLEKVGTGKLPENIFNYIITHQGMTELYFGRKKPILVTSNTEWNIDGRAINWMLKLFDEEWIIADKFTGWKKHSISEEEFVKKWEEVYK